MFICVRVIVDNITAPMMHRYLILTFVVLCSCAKVYVPNARNVTMFSQKGEFNGSIGTGISGANVQSAYAITNHLGVMANYLYANNKSSDQFHYRKHRLGEFGIGYYQHKEKLFFETFAGFGWGKGYGQDSITLFTQSVKRTKGSYERIFVQPSIGVDYGIFAVAVTFRLSRLNFSTLEYSENDVNLYISGKPRYFLESAITGRIYPRRRNIYFYAQMGFAHLLNPEGSEDDDLLDYSRAQLSVGMGIRLRKQNKTDYRGN